MHTKLFNIHNLITIKINYTHVGILRDIDFPFSFFETTVDDGHPDLILNICPFEPILKNTFVVDHKYYVTKDYFFCNDQSNKSKWKVAISGLNSSPTVVDFEGSIIGLERFLIPNYLAQNVILRPLLELKLLEKGYVMLHGVGLSYNDDSILLLGRGGAHKTPLIMDLLKQKIDYKITGDDRSLIGPKSELFSLPIFYNVLTFKSQHMTDEHISTFYNKINLGLYLIKPRYENTHLFNLKTNLKRIFFISVKVGLTEIQTNGPIDVKVAVKKILSSNKLEMMNSGFSDALCQGPFYRYLLAYSYIFTDGFYGHYWQELEKALYTILKNTSISEILLPEKYSSEISNYIKSIMSSL